MQFIEGRSLDAVIRGLADDRRRNAGGSDARRRDSYNWPASGPPLPSSHERAGDFSHSGLTRVISPIAGDQSHAGTDAVGTSIDAGKLPATPSGSGTTASGRFLMPHYRRVAEVGIQVADALAQAHHHGVLHRDIKPANLLLDQDGTIWVTDFGLARAEGSEELTSPGDVVGTLRYMAPERFHGVSDPRGDLYSLGLTLYELLTLKPTFPGAHCAELIHSILHTEPIRPRTIDPQVPIDLDTIILKAIARSPIDRFATADEMARAREVCRGDCAIRSRQSVDCRAGLAVVETKPIGRVVDRSGAAPSTLLAIVSTAAAWKYREQRNAIGKAQSETQANLNKAENAERASLSELRKSLLGEARALRYSGQPGRRAESLERLTRAADLARASGASSTEIAELRDEAIATLVLVDDGPSRVWHGSSWSSETTASSIETNRYVVVDPGGPIHVHRLSDRVKIQTLARTACGHGAGQVFVPGGRFLIVLARPRETELWDLEARNRGGTMARRGAQRHGKWRWPARGGDPGEWRCQGL